MSDDARKSRLALWVLLALVAVVVAIALVAVLTRGQSATYDPDSAEGVVQRYVQAVNDGDTAAAMDLLAPEITEDCDRLPPIADENRVVLVSTTEHDETARVRVVITTVSGSGPISDEYQSDEVFDLVRDGDTWLIDGAPWQFTICYPNGTP
ncbi:hypothetical protein PTQ19_09725 [Microbacterium esteraromaticum]|uniref:hypothetical protein n=1 Tax=Microbacterium esteraromaticum TaxID=57043 RepID=UPI00236851A0|nr:hypothetical protein [Microbacterium esteraromaticum]WDH77802.1 hypothetical protein PTQ19_09725 [Microbacterium esteraromaticum]